MWPYAKSLCLEILISLESLPHKQPWILFTLTKFLIRESFLIKLKELWSFLRDLKNPGGSGRTSNDRVKVILECDSQSPSSSLTRELAEMKVLRPHPIATNQRLPGCGPAVYSDKSPGDSSTLELEKHRQKAIPVFQRHYKPSQGCTATKRPDGANTQVSCFPIKYFSAMPEQIYIGHPISTHNSGPCAKSSEKKLLNWGIFISPYSPSFKIWTSLEIKILRSNYFSRHY